MFQKIFDDVRAWAARATAAAAGVQWGDPRRYAASAAVVLIHLVLIWIVATNILLPHGDGPAREMQLTLPSLPTTASPAMEPVPDPQMQTADATPVEPTPPQIDVDVQPTGGAISGQADILPPRPDPARQNASPALPQQFAKPGSIAQVTLTILVDARGAVSEAKIAISSGQPALDSLAAAFARANWHFRAAIQAGQPVADWTTVIVRFLPKG
jgi:TonB family protein